jgi:hypothetical protein
MLTVALVCVPGGIYDNSHVHRIISQIEKHLTIPHVFDVLRSSDKPGWWAKIDLFKPGRFSGRVLYLDLDTTVVGSLDDLVGFDAPFVAIQDYQYPIRINSSVMSWDAGVADHIYTEFVPNAFDTIGKTHGDQDWIHQHIAAARFPKRWCPSYRAHVLPTGKVPKDARIIVFHGRPKPWEMEELT